jgi:3-hexulose-6-phosphate synthase/6-phospho-3-hexuloisomerase
MRKVILTRQQGPDPEVLQGFKDLLKVYSPSCVVADAQERAGVMRSFLRPLTKETRFVGPALTVRLEPGNQVDCLDALSVAQPGDVIVVDAAGETETSIWGGLMSGLCKMKGVAGAVIDGAMRDTDETRDLGFQVFAKAIVPLRRTPLFRQDGADRDQLPIQ